MILNSYAVLSVFLALLRLGLGVAVLGLAASVWRRRSLGRDVLEDRSYLVFLLTFTLLVIDLASWPLLYLMLQSYVPHWAGVMCIYGVTRIGEGSVGAARFLPDVLLLLQLSKPALVFAGGAWFVLYLLDRRTMTGALLGRLFVVLLPLGALAVADAGLELAYVGIPKKEEFPSGGCCTALDEPATRFQTSEVRDDSRRRQYLTYYGCNVVLIVTLLACTRWPGAFARKSGLLLPLALGILALASSGNFLVDVAAPVLLALPDHHCAYDLIPEVPEALVAIGLYLAAFFALGWACLARWLGSTAETTGILPGFLRSLLHLSLCGYLMSLVMLSLELALA